MQCIRWNIIPVSLNSENNKARLLNTLFKVKLLALVEQLVALLKRNFPYAFLSEGTSRQLFFQVSGSSRFKVAKVFYQILGRRLNIRRRQVRVLCRLGFLIKVIFQEKCQFWRPASAILPCEFMKTRLHHGSFPKNVPAIFGIFICFVLIGLRQGNCLSVIREMLELCWKHWRNVINA